MKTTFFLFVSLLISYSLRAQPLTDCLSFFDPLFKGRSTDSRSEAMGLTSAASFGNPNTTFYNPAGLATIKGVEVTTTYATPNYSNEDAFFLYSGVSGSLNKYITLQFSRFAYNSGIEQPSFFSNDIYKPRIEAYTLGIASNPFRNWYFGLNTKLISSQVYADARKGFLVGDLGILRKFNLSENNPGRHTLNTGLSVMNFTASEGEFLNVNENLVEDHFATRASVGFMYSFSTVNKKIYDSLALFGFTIQADYENELNYDHRTAIRTGLELTFLEMLNLRVGYYNQTVCDFGIPEYYRSSISSLTYGLGLEVPFQKFSSLPLILKMDIASLPQPSYLTDPNNVEDDFFSANARILWQL